MLVSRNISGMLWLVLAKLDWTLSSSCLTPVSARTQSSGSFPKTVGTLTGEIHQICLYIIQPWPGIHSWKRMGFRWARQFQSWSVTRPTPSWEPTLSKRSITPWNNRETKVSQSQKKLKRNLEDAHWASWIEDWALLKLERIDHSLAG